MLIELCGGPMDGLVTETTPGRQVHEVSEFIGCPESLADMDSLGPGDIAVKIHSYTITNKRGAMGHPIAVFQETQLP